MTSLQVSYLRRVCGRFANARKARELAEALSAELAEGLAADGERPRFNIAPSAWAPMLVQVPRRRLGLARFGIASGNASGAYVINARLETLAERPLFADAAAHRRCIVPADGFYEWHRHGATKTPHFIFRPADEAPPPLLLLAGLYFVERDEKGGRVPRFVIVTTPAREPLRTIHDRMPLVVPDELASTWMDTRTPLDVALASLDEAPAVALAMHAVAPLVNDAANDRPDLIDRVDPSAPSVAFLPFGDALDAHTPPQSETRRGTAPKRDPSS